MVANWEEMEYTAWLEDTVRQMVDIDPACIALELIDKEGIVHTCYWRVSADDRAQMMSGMRDDDRMEWLRLNRDIVLEILGEDEDGEEDEDEGEEWTTES